MFFFQEIRVVILVFCWYFSKKARGIGYRKKVKPRFLETSLVDFCSRPNLPSNNNLKNFMKKYTHTHTLKIKFWT